MKLLLLGSAAMSTIVVAPAAFAQSTSPETAQATAPEATASSKPVTLTPSKKTEGTVTGSRLSSDATRQPTPITTVTSDQLYRGAPGTISQALTQLPVFKGSIGPQTQNAQTSGNNALSYLNLRGIGSARTLVLLNGRRVVAATSQGNVDIAALPEALISRVEILTGGASASYGSDAVSGVVNFILDTKLTGLKASFQTGISEQGDNFNYKGSIAGGTDFLGGRGHIVGSFEYYSTNGIEQGLEREWALRSRALIPNPAVTAANPASPTNPRQLLVTSAGSSIASLGGLITNTALRGTSFGPGGTVQPFQYGQFVSASLMAGGDSVNGNLLAVLQPTQTRKVGFAHATFDVSDALSVFAEVGYSQNDTGYFGLPTRALGGTAFTIFQDNAYLPASVRSQMQTLGLASVSVGRISPDIASPRIEGSFTTQRYVGGFSGKIGSNWRYSAYYQYGRSDATIEATTNPILENVYRSVDAVVSNGTIVCRSTLTNPGDGCVPLNIFGQGSPSAAALNYVLGTSVQIVDTVQQVAGGSVRGELFDLPGGKLGLAVGVGYRTEAYEQTTDPIFSRLQTGGGIRGFPLSLINIPGGFERFNPQPSGGKYDVKTGYVELNAPLLTGHRFAYKLTVGGAYRWTIYSNSGGVPAWKVGGVYEPIKGLRLRGSVSEDIRGPNLGELFQGSIQSTATVSDPQRGGVVGNTLTGVVGNPNVVPESGMSTVYGIVLQPAFIPRLNLSVDYYSIRISNAITTLTAQQEINLCQAGATDICGFIQRNTQNVISRVALPFLNVANRNTSGVDFEASWDGRVPGGTFGVRLLVSYLDKFETQIGTNQVLDLAGDIGVNSTPKWSGTLGTSYVKGPFSLYVQERFIGSGKFDNSLTTTDVAFNSVPAIAYTDATFTVDIGHKGRYQFFTTVNNLFDQDPPLVPGYLTIGSTLTNRMLYDVVGRAFTAGIRVKL